MRVSDFLPFVSHARTLSSRYETGPVSSLIFPRGLAMPKGMPVEYAQEHFRNKAIPVFVPNDDLTFLVPDVSGIEVRLLSNLPGDTLVTLQVREVDYSEVLRKVLFDRERGAYYDVVGVSEYESVSEEMEEALKLAASGEYESLGRQVATPPPALLKEDVLPAGISGDAQVLSLDKIERFLTNYITFREGSERVPVLLGNTAVAKSAVVKSVAKKLGRRIVDFRCAFIDKQDIEGFREKFRDPNTGEIFSTTAPPEMIMQCTDRFLEYCTVTVNELRGVLPSIKDKEELAATKKTIARLEKLAVPPVLFFDEVTRASKAVQNAFVQILNNKSFRGMDMKKARIVAATNYPVDLPDEFKAAYLVQNMNDAGIVERYESIEVHPEDVGPRWMDYIEGDGGFDPVVVEFLKEDPDHRYNMGIVQGVIDASERGTQEPGGPAPDPLVQGPIDIGVIPFPNYRTWEFVNDHVRAVREGKTPLSEKLIFGYIGKNFISEAFLERVRDQIPEASVRPPGDDFLTETIDAAYHTGSPILIIGMTSIGKTSRIKLLENKYGAKVVEINLAQKDRVDIQGAPGTLPIEEMVSPGGTDRLPPEISAILNKNVKTHLKSSPNITRKNQDYALRATIDAARADGRKVVLFFDELNRASPFTMSAVLEAVSDQKFGGVEFPWICTNPAHVDEDGNRWSAPRDDIVKAQCPQGHKAEPQVLIAAACNYGANYKAVNKLDPAISGRFSVIQKLEFDETDRASILLFMRENNYPEVVVKWIEGMTFEALKKMLTSVEERGVNEAAPSLRGLKDAALAITQVKDPSMQGKLLSVEEEAELSLPVSTPEEALRRMDSLPANWAGYSQDQVVLGGKSYTMRELVESMRETQVALQQQMNGQWASPGMDGPTGPDQEEMLAKMRDFNFLLGILVQNNTRMRTYRETEFRAKFGKHYADEFLPFYNSMMGETILEIQDVVSRELADQYVKQILGKYKDEPQRLEKFQELFGGFYDFFGPSATDAMYRNVLLAVSAETTTEMFQSLVMDYTVSSMDKARGFFNRALDAETTLLLLGDFGFGGNPELLKPHVEGYYKSGAAPTGTDGHPPDPAKIPGGQP